MAPSPVPGPVVPNPRIPSALGVLNLLLGALALLTGLSLIGWELFAPRFWEWLHAGPGGDALFGGKTVGEQVAFWAGETAGLALNAALVVAGVGLVGLRPWGRRLALWVAGLKLALLAAVTAVSLLVLIPNRVQRVRQEAARSASAGQWPPGGAAAWATEAAQETAVTYSLWSASELVFSSIYPALTLWLLNKRSVRAALIAPSAGPGGPGPAPEPS